MRKKVKAIDDSINEHLGKHLPLCLWCAHMRDPWPSRRYCDYYHGRAPDRFWIHGQECPHYKRKGG